MIPKPEALLKGCEDVLAKHVVTANGMRELPDSDFKREMQQKLADSIAVAEKAQRGTREALIRERAKLN